MQMATFAIVPGAWGGAWSWNKMVVPLLRKAGHEVHAITLTGLGDRVHLATPDVDLDTHIQDVVNVLFYEDLHDVILAGHSYAGMVITGVADRVPERLRQLVYLDAATPASGTRLVDRAPGPFGEMVAAAEREADGWRIPTGPVPADQSAAITEWASPRQVMQPVRTFSQPLTLQHGETTLPRSFVYCALDKIPGGDSALRAAEIKGDPSWRYFELQTGHNLHYSAPEETVAILNSLARQRIRRAAVGSRRAASASDPVRPHDAGHHPRDVRQQAAHRQTDLRDVRVKGQDQSLPLLAADDGLIRSDGSDAPTEHDHSTTDR